MSHLTESIVDFVARMPSCEIPQDMVDLAVTGFSDAIGVMLAGMEEESVQRFRNYVHTQGGVEESRIMLGNSLTSASYAALLGATAAHVLDYDDYAYSNHPSAVMVPAILAEADVINASGDQMVRAYIAGYEAWGAVMKREPDHLHSKGWHPTAVFGPIGVAVAISTLRGLDRDTTRNAIGFAVAHGGGVMGNFGAMSKPFQGGRAAQAGIASVRMAMAGLTSGPDALDGLKGLLFALSPNGNVDLESSAEYLGREWYGSKHGLNVKRYPTVGASQRVIDAALDVKQRLDPALDQIQSIKVHISEKHAAVMPFHLAQDEMQAKFCLEFATAAALISGSVGLAELKKPFVQRDDVQALMKKVVLDIGPDDDPVYPVGAAEDWIEVTLNSGETLTSARINRALGHGHNPMPAELLKEKFMTCATWTGKLDTAGAEQLFDQLQGLRDLSSVTELAL